MSRPEIGIVTAITEHGHLAPMGNGRAEWYMPEDLERFRQITTGHAVIVAAVTFETILEALGRPLPNRTNIIVGATGRLPRECVREDDFKSALRTARDYEQDEIFVMGDGKFYEEVFPSVTKLYLTIVQGNYRTDEQFPDYQDSFELLTSEYGRSGEFDYVFQTLARRKGATIEL